MLADLKRAIRIVVDNARRDPINGAILPLVGVALFALAWWRGWLTWDYIKYILFHDIH